MNKHKRIDKEVELKAAPSVVWRALTDHRQFGDWFRVKVDGPFAAGEIARGQITHPGYEHLSWEVRVQTMDPETLFSFTWHPYAVDPETDYSNETPTLVEFSLEPTANGTRLRVTESGFEALPRHRGDEAFAMNEGGWTEQIKNIERYVSGAD